MTTDRYLRPCAFAGVLVAMLAGQFADAAVFTWTGNASGNEWDATNFPSTTNWSSNGIPGFLDSIVLNSVTAGSIFVDLNGNRSIISATLQGSNSIFVTNSTLTLTSGDLTVNSSGPTFVIQSGINLGSTGNWSISGGTTSLNISGPILGGFGIDKTGTGTLQLSGSNTFLGATNISGGAIRVSNTNALQNSTVNVNVVNGLLLSTSAALGGLGGNASFDIGSNSLTVGGNNSSTQYGGSISGSGGFTKSGGGTLTLIGNQSYNGGTTVNSGTLSLGNGGASGSVTGNILNNATLRVNRSNAYEHTGSITGSGVFFKEGAGTFTLHGMLSQTAGIGVSAGTLIVDGSASTGTANVAGTLQIGDGGGGSFSGNVLLTNPAAQLVFNLSGSPTYAGTINGSGQLIKRGTGTLTLASSSGYGGGTVLEEGTLSIGNDSQLGASGVEVTGMGGTLRVSGTHSTTRDFDTGGSLGFDISGGVDYTIEGDILGIGPITKLGIGTLIIAGDQASAGLIDLQFGTLQIGNGGTTGAIARNVSNNGTLVFDRSDDIVYGGQISGNGSLRHQGAGKLALTGVNSYFGPTTVVDGTLQIAADDNLGNSTLLTLDNATLRVTSTHATSRNITLQGVGTFDIANGVTYTINGNLGTTGALNKIGDGTLVLAGTGAYTDGTTVAGGLLRAASTAALGTGPLDINGGNVEITGDANIGLPGVTGPNSVNIAAGGSLSTDPGDDLTIGSFGQILMTDGMVSARRVRAMFGSELTGSGTVAARFLADVGSMIEATGDLDLGDAAAVNGFYSAGDLKITTGTTTLHDANTAVLDSSALVTLGDGAGGSATLAAPNGLTVDFGANIVGFGAVETPNTAATPLMNNGHIGGNSPAEMITLSGYVKGVGTLDNVTITGTDAPGFSPATVVRGSVLYNGTLQIDVEGSSAGEFDRIEHLIGDGVADLGGALEVIADANVDVEVGDFLQFIYAEGGIFNEFESVVLPSLNNGKAFRLIYGETIVGLEVILQGDYNSDGVVNAADYAMWRDTLGQSGAGLPADGNGDEIVNQPDYGVWRANFGMAAGSGSSLNEAANVPEPSTLVLLLSAGAMLLCRRRLALS